MPSDQEAVAVSNFSPREIQERALSLLRSEYSQGRKRVVLVAPAGSGKTGTGYMLARNSYEKTGKPAIFFCNRDSLVSQTVERFKEYGFTRVARWQYSHYSMDDLKYAEVIVASLQTATRRPKSQWPAASLVMFDEVHSGVAASDKSRQLVFHYANIPIIGLTATPYAKGLGKFYSEIEGNLFESCVQPMHRSEAIKKGLIVDCDIFCPTQVDMSGVKVVTKNGERDYEDSESAKRAMKVTGDAVTWWLRLANGKKTIVFTQNVEHASQVTQAYLDAGVDAELIHGYMDSKKQQEIIGRYARDEVLMLVCPCLLGVGFDQPKTEVVQWLRATKNKTVWEQYATRAGRAYPGKDKYLLIDHIGTSIELGFPTDDIDPVLDDGKPKRAAEQIEKEKPDAKKCPQCHAMLRSRPFFPCPHCGYTRIGEDLEVQDGDLQKLERGKKPKKWKPEPGLETYRQLKGWAEEKGFKTGSAYHKYMELFGVKPAWEWGSADSLPCPDALNELIYRAYLHQKRKMAYAKRSFG